jgi:hypothetical protein
MDEFFGSFSFLLEHPAGFGLNWQKIALIAHRHFKEQVLAWIQCR